MSDTTQQAARPKKFVSDEVLSQSFRVVEDVRKDQWGYYHALGWNDALRRMMDYAQFMPSEDTALPARSAAPDPAPVAVVCDVYELRWIGSGPIAPLIRKHGIKVGDYLYAATPADKGDVGLLDLLRQALEALTEHYYEGKAGKIRPVIAALRQRLKGKE